MQKQKEKLKRTFGLFALFIYGLGDILGAGIYALIGKVAAETGRNSWMAFLLAMVIALLTALSYAELTRRHPKSGGASYFVQKAFNKHSYAFVVGWLLLCVSIVSMATLGRAFYGYAQGLGLSLSPIILIALFFILLTLINLRGMKQSSAANIVSTSVELFGLIIVAAAGIYFLQNNVGGSSAAANTVATTNSLSPLGILQGAALAFYAFIGFEDLANVAEEVIKPEKHLPIAILASLFVAGIFYVFIGWLSTQVLSVEVLAKASDPMTQIVTQSQFPFPVKIFGVIALFAVANTCLLNFITGSRLLYGMAEQDLVPTLFEKVHHKYSTPYVAILSVVPVAFLLASFGKLEFLAGTTSVLILLVFCSTNISLIKIKKNEKEISEGFTIPVIVPWLALATNFMLIFFSEAKSLYAAGGFLAAGLVLYMLLQSKPVQTILRQH